MGLTLAQRQGPAWAHCGLAKATGAAHFRMLSELKARLASADSSRPLHLSLIDAFSAWRQEAGWSWTTTARYMGSIVGAFHALPMYSNSPYPLQLLHTSEWKLAIRMAEREANADPAKIPAAATSEDVREALALTPDPHQQALLILAWITSARFGDVAQLHGRDAVLGPPTTVNGRSGYELSVTFRRHKTSARVQPYTVHTFLPSEWLLPLQAAWVVDNEPVFPRRPGRPITELTAQTLKRVHRSLEARSIRRGSLQAMAVSGMSHDMIRTFSGHRSNEMLLRYLGWGAVVGAAELQAMRSAAAISA